MDFSFALEESRNFTAVGREPGPIDAEGGERREPAEEADGQQGTTPGVVGPAGHAAHAANRVHDRRMPDGAEDGRNWLDHGASPTGTPLATSPGTPPAHDYPFLPVEGDNLHQIPVGPVHAGIIEPGHFRFTANGETVVRLEERLGYVHKGVESLMTGLPIEQAARVAARISGDSTVAYSYAFARAIEAAVNAVRVAAPSSVESGSTSWIAKALRSSDFGTDHSNVRAACLQSGLQGVAADRDLANHSVCGIEQNL